MLLYIWPTKGNTEIIFIVPQSSAIYCPKASHHVMKYCCTYWYYTAIMQQKHSSDILYEYQYSSSRTTAYINMLRVEYDTTSYLDCRVEQPLAQCSLP